VRPDRGGVIHSRLVLSPSGSGFSARNEISYRVVKPPRVSAALRGSELRREVDLPQVDAPGRILNERLTKPSHRPGGSDNLKQVGSGRGCVRRACSVMHLLTEIVVAARKAVALCHWEGRNGLPHRSCGLGSRPL
jgi:hypothetical protein